MASFRSHEANSANAKVAYKRLKRSVLSSVGAYKQTSINH